MLTLYLTANKTIGSALIRAFTWSKWSHVVIEDGDHIIEANWLKGVQRIPRHEALKKVSRMARIDVGCNNPEAILARIRSQIGKSYDFMSLLGFLFHKDWQRTDKWNCSELPAWAMAIEGEPVFRLEDASRIAPGHWWLIAPERLAF
jgi:hypothetical protein